MSKQSQKLIDQLRANLNEEGAVTISAVQVAVLVRAQLKKMFPEVKFSVRSDFNSVNITWQNGPCDAEVSEVVSRYSFGGFDGMIDLSYSQENWLHPDGTMSPAASCGTEGSRGTVPRFATDCPEPGAFIVKYGPNYIFTRRETTDEFDWGLARQWARVFGFDLAEDIPLHEQRYHGESVSMMLHRFETSRYEAARRRANKPRYRLTPHGLVPVEGK